MGFVAGVSLAAWQGLLFYLCLLLSCAYLVYRRCIKGDQWRHLSWQILLVCLGWYHADQYFAPLDIKEPDQLDNRWVTLTGWVERIQTTQGYVQLWIQSQEPVVGRVILRCYRCWTQETAPKVGEQWLFETQLKRPILPINPGGGFFEKWLYRQAVMATGAIRTGQKQKNLQDQALVIKAQARLAYMQESVRARISDLKQKGLLEALWMGDKTGLSAEHKVWIQKTGTQHLLVVSGMHLGAMVLFATMLAGLLSRCLAFIRGRQILQIGLLVIMGLGFSLFYAALAGFGVSAIRALVMVSIGLMLWCSNLKLGHFQPWGYALVVVLWLDPGAIFDPGFYLSFSAVWFLLRCFAVVKPVSSDQVSSLRSGCVSLLQAQFVIAVGLLPWSSLLAMPVAPSSLWVNLIAIPWITLWLLPVSWLALAVQAFFDVTWALPWLDQQLGYFIHALGYVAEYPGLNLDGYWAKVCQWLGALSKDGAIGAYQETRILGLSLIWVLATALLFIPRTLAPRYWTLGLYGLCAGATIGAVYQQQHYSSHFESGVFEVQILDVGQGLAVLVRTAEGDVLYDTGPTYQRELKGFFNRIGIRKLSKLVLSHDDRDHVGGLDGLLADVRVEHLVKPRTQTATHWSLGGVRFQILRHKGARNDNDGSWILLITSPFGKVLIPGDIGISTEKWLIKQKMFHNSEPVQLLLAPHHGSGRSSSMEFLAQVRPMWAVFSAGYRNQYQHPRQAAIERYESLGTKMLTTANTGCLVFRFDARQSWRSPSVYRSYVMGRWQRQNFFEILSG